MLVSHLSSSLIFYFSVVDCAILNKQRATVLNFYKMILAFGGESQSPSCLPHPAGTRAKPCITVAPRAQGQFQPHSLTNFAIDSSLPSSSPSSTLVRSFLSSTDLVTPFTHPQSLVTYHYTMKMKTPAALLAFAAAAVAGALDGNDG
jgi:hypothetical protein